MSQDSMSPLFTWRSAIASEYGPGSKYSPNGNSTTRHVLLTLSLHMSERGDSCFPSTRTLEDETGLSRRSVETHLEHAVADGWIERDVHGLSGQGWRRFEYGARVPDPVRAAIEAEGGEAPSPRSDDSAQHEGSEEGGERGSPRPEGGEPHAEGGEPRSKKVANEVPMRTSVEDDIEGANRDRGGESSPTVEDSPLSGEEEADREAETDPGDASPPDPMENPVAWIEATPDPDLVPAEDEKGVRPTSHWMDGLTGLWGTPSPDLRRAVSRASGLSGLQATYDASNREISEFVVGAWLDRESGDGILADRVGVPPGQPMGPGVISHADGQPGRKTWQAFLDRYREFEAEQASESGAESAAESLELDLGADREEADRVPA